MVMRFPAKKNACCPKAPRDFPPRKDGILYPRRPPSTPVVEGDSPPPPTESVRMDGRTYGCTDGHVTITSQPKFLGLIGYQISLAMELRWRALPAGSAIRIKRLYTLSNTISKIKQIQKFMNEFPFHSIKSS